MQKKTPSRLSTRQQRTLLAVVALGVFMVADTLYLLTNRLADALGFRLLRRHRHFPAQVLPRHGAVAYGRRSGAGRYWRWALWLGIYRRFGARAASGAILTGIATLTLGIVLAISGLFILSAASNRGNPVAYWSHVAAAVLVPLFYLAQPPSLAVEALGAELSRRARSGGWGCWR